MTRIATLVARALACATFLFAHTALAQVSIELLGVPAASSTLAIMVVPDAEPAPTCLVQPSAEPSPTCLAQPSAEPSPALLAQPSAQPAPIVSVTNERRALDPRRAYDRLLRAAKNARSGTARDCYRTSVRTAQINGARGNGFTWRETRAYRGRQLEDGLRDAIDAGSLKPGMVIFANRRPGTDYLSQNLGNLPHWFTYLGKNAAGVDRFSDQYACDWSFMEIVREYGGSRRIDAFLDPYAR